MWAGVEPEAKKYNMTYLNVMSDIIQSLAAKQIYVLLDMHQDVLSSQTGSYDGIPVWLYNRFPASKHPCMKFLLFFFEYTYFFSFKIHGHSKLLPLVATGVLGKCVL